MVGQIQIITYLLAAYLVYKGIEIFQVAFVSSNEKSRMIGIILGVFAIIGSIGIGIFIIYLMDEQASHISKRNYM